MQAACCLSLIHILSAFAPDNHDLGVKIRVENHEAAPRYAGVTVKNCKIAPSPEWMQNCLRAAGINPKNNLVDITNFVLFELGQPLHAFDAAKIEGREVVVRTCAEGTPFVTLDGVERKLTADDLMICSAEMCIRDRPSPRPPRSPARGFPSSRGRVRALRGPRR